MGMRELEISDQNLTIYELDDVYDAVTGHTCTGSWIWDSALFLSQWLVTSSFDLQAKFVLELGAGLGLPGLMAAKLGANRVMLTDVAQLLHGLRKNVDVNGLENRVEAREIVWGFSEGSRTDGELGKFDVVLMSDVFYDMAETTALGRTLKRVCGGETMVLAASEIRCWSGECLGGLVSQGFEVVELPSHVECECDALVGGGGVDKFAIYRLIPPTK
ncbi:hypothetical protein K2173_019305 [Erythroxylum novogranatense]|uniref:Uncharacterized protein n=1 Tax=Erythroxylum novogranatense TaxID=1862640 RepID=A0AAV8STB6_9ROSI|nr:hypothetical protein K2173_019305 [Erythroxylum novogranatense]